MRKLETKGKISIGYTESTYQKKSSFREQYQHRQLLLVKLRRESRYYTRTVLALGRATSTVVV